MKYTLTLLTALLLAPLASLHAADAHEKLSPHQRVIFESKSPPAIAATFSFDAPPGPQFSEAEKQAQRDKGAGVVPMVRKAFDAGAESVTIPPGDYRFGKETRAEGRMIYPLEFRGLKRDAAKPFRIIAQGVTFWFELPPDQLPKTHFALGFVDCSHITLEGVTLDRDPRGCMEGCITQIDDAGNRIEIEAIKGTLVPTHFSGVKSQRIVPFNADGTFCTALFALQHGPGQLKYRDVSPSTQPGRFWVNLDAKSELLNTNRDPGWRLAYGEAGTLQPGDGLCLLYSGGRAIDVLDCENLSFLGVRNYFGPVRELGGAGGHLWKDCYFGPRPGTCHWQGGQGILTGCMERGCIYDGLTMMHTMDDLLDIHGFWGYIEKVEGKSITIQRDPQMPAQSGDHLNFFDAQTGAPVGQAIVESVDKQTLTINRDAAPFTNAIAENIDRQSNGWEIRNCTFTDCYQRLLVRGGNGGTLRDCRFIRVGSSIQLASNFFTKNEGGICRDISVLNNTFEDVAIHPDGVTLNASFQSLNHKACTPLLTNITVRGNTFINSGSHAIEFSLVSGGEISANTFRDPGRYRALAGRPPASDGPQPVQLKDCNSIALRGNRVISSGKPIPPAASTGSSLVNATGSRVNILCEP